MFFDVKYVLARHSDDANNEITHNTIESLRDDMDASKREKGVSLPTKVKMGL